MQIMISDFGLNRRYIATKESDCKDQTDLEVFKLVCFHQDVITMGKVIGHIVQNPIQAKDDADFQHKEVAKKEVR